MERALSQDEIDSVFRGLKARPAKDAQRAIAYDFRRPDRISRDQLRSVHVLHDNFARNLASSLSAYLRAYVIANLISVEQVSFAEFSGCLPSPTCLVCLALRPYDANAVLEINSTLVFPILEMLLGGNGKNVNALRRELTEIEQVVLDGLYRIILNDLTQAWRGVAHIEFRIEGTETEPQLLQIMSPNEAVVSISLELRVGEASGLVNIGIPSSLVKKLRQKFDQQWSARRVESTETEQRKILGLLGPAFMDVEACLLGPSMRIDDLLTLAKGDLLVLDFPAERAVSLRVNGQVKYTGQVAAAGRKRAFVIARDIAG